ncbi:Ribonuclease VapC [Tumidithrix helvetica PCC 7403]|uniref:type II toxin-antitoxin system VapC family toxin n=1 Tax=Tumidithrix helvetica TaxID=3457545 RepID=UPI003CA3D039
MEIVIADTGFVVALTNRSDPRHITVRDIYSQQQKILLPQTVLAEVAYLVGREAGIATVVKFLKGLSASRFLLVELIEADILRTAEILEAYADSRIDFVDASIMALAERLNLVTVLTLDRRDFSLFRPRHCNSFILVP